MSLESLAIVTAMAGAAVWFVLKAQRGFEAELYSGASSQESRVRHERMRQGRCVGCGAELEMRYDPDRRMRDYVCRACSDLFAPD